MHSIVGCKSPQEGCSPFSITFGRPPTAESTEPFRDVGVRFRCSLAHAATFGGIASLTFAQAGMKSITKRYWSCSGRRGTVRQAERSACLRTLTTAVAVARREPPSQQVRYEMETEAIGF